MWSNPMDYHLTNDQEGVGHSGHTLRISCVYSVGSREFRRASPTLSKFGSRGIRELSLRNSPESRVRNHFPLSRKTIFFCEGSGSESTRHLRFDLPRYNTCSGYMGLAMTICRTSFNLFLFNPFSSRTKT